MRSGRRTLPRAAGGRREEMEHLSTHNRRVKSQSKESWTLELVSPQKPFQRGGGLLKLGVWLDGRVYGEVQDSF